MHPLRAIADEILDSAEEFSVNEVVDILTAADELYHNGEESFLADKEYDIIRNIASRMDPANVYFTGVGSDVRGGKVKLPYEMGSLDQVEIGGITDWIGNWGLQKEELILTDKMDGTSAMIVYDKDGVKQIAYSRGNGTEGADISRHIFKIANVPSDLPCRHKMVIRGEVELSETSFKILQEKVMSRSGKPYKNARNMVAGLMNSKTNPDVVYEHLKFIAYEIVGSTTSKSEMLTTLRKQNFKVVSWASFFGYELTDDMLAKYLDSRRKALNYAIDGIVIDVDSESKRAEMNPSRDTLNPAYSVKYKVADASNIAIADVLDVEWNISKHGYLKPRVKIKPVELVGVTVQHATGFNAKFIYDNGIGPGAKIKITRSGDVIPFILDVVKKAIPCMPGSMHPEEMGWDWDWNETGVDAVLKNFDNNEEVAIQQTIDFFASIDAPHLREGNIRKMMEAYEYTSAHSAIYNMIAHTQKDWERVVGENGKKIYRGLKEKFSNMPLYVLAGSVPFFGRGVGKRKFKKLITGLGIESVADLMNITTSQIVNVEGFEAKTAQKIKEGMKDFYQFYIKVKPMITLAAVPTKTGGSMSGQKVVFTGFRDKDLQAAIEAAGGEIQSTVSGKTTILVAKNPNSGSGKLTKAREKGVKVIGIDELKGML